MLSPGVVEFWVVLEKPIHVTRAFWKENPSDPSRIPPPPGKRRFRYWNRNVQIVGAASELSVSYTGKPIIIRSLQWYVWEVSRT